MADCFLMRKGQTQNIEYGENIFDLEIFKTNLSSASPSVYKGNIEWLNNGFKITATSTDCYTNDWYSGLEIAAKQNTLYELSFDLVGANGNIFVFVSSNTTYRPTFYFLNQNKKFIFRIPENGNSIIIRFGVQSLGESATYSDIKFREILNG